MDSEVTVTEKDFRPFARLGKYLSESFLAEAVDLLFLVREHGISQITSPPTTSAEFLNFAAHTHDGWKAAQKRIAALLTDALTRRNEARESAKKCRRLRDRQGDQSARRDEHRIELEIRVLRRTLDVILWTIFVGDHSTLRRLFVIGGKHNLSIKNIADAMPTADQINEDPHTIALCTDMLSLVHVGDLLVLNRKTREYSFIELKAGDKNYGISKMAEFAASSGCQLFQHIATADFDKTDIKHYERAKRQIERSHTILNTIRNEGGKDPNTGADVNITAVDEAPDLWCDRITSCYNQLNESKTWAIATIDKCVHVGVYSDQDIAFVGFKSWMRGLKCESPIYNLTDSFQIPSARPLGATFLSLELQTRVLRGEILVIICLDILKLIEMANEARAGFLSLASRAETAKARAISKFQSLELNGRFVKVGTDPAFEYLGAGFRDRVVFDQQRPFQLIQHHILRRASATQTVGAEDD